MKKNLLCALLTANLAGSVFAGVEEGLTAYKKGDFGSALQEFRIAAEQGQAEAQFNLGFMYANGQGIPPDYSQAMYWYRQAANQGHAAAQNNLGFMYAKGLGIKPDHELAIQWYRKAAVQGFVGAKANLERLEAESMARR